MRLLAVDTALGACSAAVLDGERVLARCLEPMERGHAERLAPMVQETMNEAMIRFDALDRLAVTIGPGGFTGQRVGYAFMRGLRLALKRPLVGITTLDAMAQAALAQENARAAAVLHDARRQEVYVRFVANGITRIEDRLDSFANALDAICDAAGESAGPLTVAGTAAARTVDALALRGRRAIDAQIAWPDALWVARIAYGAPIPDSVPRPLYLRPPDARLPSPSP